MTQDEVAAMIERLIADEGGYVDHPRDAGGCTNMGITLATLEANRGKPTTCVDVRALHKSEAAAIYRKRYVDHKRLMLAEWPYATLAAVALDVAVMFGDGPKMAATWVQEAINAMRPGDGKVKVDGWAGQDTRKAMAQCDERDLVGYVVAKRYLAHVARVVATPSQIVFLEGWAKRATAWLMKPVAQARVPEPIVPPEPTPAPEPVAPPPIEHGRYPPSGCRWVVQRERTNIGGVEYWTDQHVGPQRECNPVVTLDVEKSARWIDKEAAERAMQRYGARMAGQGFHAARLP